MTAVKRCCACHQQKPLTSYNKDCSRKDGLQARCRECGKASSKQWKEDNKVQHSLNMKVWRDQNKEKMSESGKRWRDDHVDYVKEQIRNYHLLHHKEYLK